MKKTIGIVAEGPRDYDMLVRLIDSITGEEHHYQRIQPQPDADGELGNGWKGVWKWCETHREYLKDYFYSISPRLDMLIIHMDGDVARKEKEVHCHCKTVYCDLYGNTHPLKCSGLIKKECSIKMPCRLHEPSPQGYASFLKEFLEKQTGADDELPICFLTPCDSTDTWIVAACEEREQYESIDDPWESVICHAPCYCGVHMRNRPKKSSRPYNELISIVERNWSSVRKRCPQAEAFTNDVLRILSNSQ